MSESRSLLTHEGKPEYPFGQPYCDCSMCQLAMQL